MKLYVLETAKGEWLYNKTDGKVRFCAYTSFEKAESARTGMLQEKTIKIVRTNKEEIGRRQKEVNKHRKGPAWERMRAAEDEVARAAARWLENRGSRKVRMRSQ